MKIYLSVLLLTFTSTLLAQGPSTPSEVPGKTTSLAPTNLETTSSRKRLNIQVSPMSFLEGMRVLGEYSLTPSLSVGPVIQYQAGSLPVSQGTVRTDQQGFWDIMRAAQSQSEIPDTYTVGVFGKLYTNGQGLSDSYYLQALTSLRHYNFKTPGLSDKTGVYGEFTVGHHWYWNNGLNLALGIGLMLEQEPRGLPFLPTADFQVGYSF